MNHEGVVKASVRLFVVAYIGMTVLISGYRSSREATRIQHTHSIGGTYHVAPSYDSFPKFREARKKEVPCCAAPVSRELTPLIHEVRPPSTLMALPVTRPIDAKRIRPPPPPGSVRQA
jgi:hypothetical protein